MGKFKTISGKRYYFDEYGNEYSEDKECLISVNKELTEFAIPDSVTRIGCNAFRGCTGLTSITIPDSVTRIDFSGCTGLTSITIPNSVTSIGWNTFLNCTGLTSITIPNSVTSIGNCAFSGCTGLTSITIPDSVTSIGVNAFSCCSGLTSIKVSKKNKIYDSRNNCNAIIETETNTLITGCNSTIIPESVTSIDHEAFSGCSGLTSITIPDSVTEIGSYAFYGCTGLMSITIPDSVTSIGESAFCGCTGLTSITIPDSVTEIGSYAFYGCTSLMSITIPDSVTSIGESAFCGCTGLTSITIPDSVIGIDWGAFSGCTGLTSITIPDSVTKINPIAFEDCTSLKQIKVPKGTKNKFTSMLANYASIIIEDDDSDKLYNLADCFEKGIGVVKDVAQAIVFYIQASDKGNYQASYRLGEIYELGIGISKNINQALCYYEKAAEYKYKDSVECAERCRNLIKQENERMSEYLNSLNSESHASNPVSPLKNQKATLLFFDTETTGLPKNYGAPISDSYNWPRIVQFSWILTDDRGNEIETKDYIIKPDGFTIPFEASNIHGITTEYARQNGVQLEKVLNEFISDMDSVNRIIGHNIDFDVKIIAAEFYRKNISHDRLVRKQKFCTMQSTIEFCALPPYRYGSYKYPKLQELYKKLFGYEFSDAHNSLCDIRATKDCYFEMKRLGTFGI